MSASEPRTCVRCTKPLDGFWIGIGDESCCMGCGADRLVELSRAAAQHGDANQALQRAVNTIRTHVGDYDDADSTKEWRDGMLHAAFLVEQMISTPSQSRIEASADDLLRAAALDAGIAIEALQGRGRDPRTIRARDLVCVRLRAAGLSLPTIGRLVKRDHSTVLYTLRKVADPVATRARNKVRGQRAKLRGAGG